MTKSQLHLFVRETGKRVKAADPITSVIAAEAKVTSGSIESEHEQIKDVLRRKADYDENHPGLTCAEICAEIAGMKWRAIYVPIARRIGELVWNDKDKTIPGPVYVVCKRISAVGGMRAQAYRIKPCTR